MKTRHALLLLPAVLLPIALIAQGPLTPPPGAPAPVMKTLQQVEPRIDVATLPGDATSVFLISAPGSYYLSSRVTATTGKAGIAIAASDVSLDLNGFGITGAAGVTRGVELRNGANGVSVRNGIISGVPGGPGAGLATGAAAIINNVEFADLTIRNCAGGIVFGNFQGLTVERVRVTGVTANGIDAGNTAKISHCTVEGVTGVATGLFGIRGGAVQSCEVTLITNTLGFVNGIFATHVKDCTVSGLTSAGNGLTGIAGDTVTSCKVAGVRATTAGSVRGIASSGKVTGCAVTDVGDTGPGTPIGIAGSHIDACHVTSVGGAESTSVITGITSTVSASHCTVTAIGVTGVAQSVTGIQTGLATHCRAVNLDGSRSMTGITAITAIGCIVDGMDQTNGGNGPVTGLHSDRMIDCQVTAIDGNSTASILGFNNYTTASGCSASGISNTGTGNSGGFQAAANSHTLNCLVETTGSFGISGSSGSVVRGCSVRLNGATAAFGTGITLAGARGMIEDNFVHTCGTGIDAGGTNILVARNRVSNCNINILATATCQTGPQVSATGAIVSTSPWANFTD